MSYANQYPVSFKNHIEKIAIVGASGQSGSYIVEELLKTGKHKVTAITRADSNSKFPAGVEVKRVDYDNQSSLVEALQGQEALIITMGVMAPQDQQTKLIEAAAAAKVAWVIPNEFGGDNANEALLRDIPINAVKVQYREQIEKLGVSSWIGICCNFWYDYSLSRGNYSIDIKNRTATFWDDGNTRINTSTLPQVGLGVANLLNLKVLPDNEQDTSPCLSNYKNKFVYIASFCLSQREMLASILRVTNATEEDWKIEYRPVEEVFKEGVERFQKGDFMGMLSGMYSRNFFKDNSGNYELTRGLDNEKLGLPKEDVDKYTKIAVDAVLNGDVAQF
ncbi:hypothetical protein K450DRAFT_247776 [Umbelopsis ramanniana AG]|uniref:NmrA-like domain-containing protein n=1 Tax=Umbelopsis ramanniana AG TaxID=1314678 RepID=A0AAD5E7Q8_UMBRA|nr:uncharacterized protein K450DRAFT_247776 [Umbelopsis ramanniana AG]KAI8578409.1 hypothetical protein K450DRAFT_247776 [Umbelopsis ramanniana AG]